MNVESDLDEKFWGLRLTVDTMEDFELISEVFRILYPTKPTFGLEDVIALVTSQPQLLLINRHIRQKPIR